MEKSWQQGGVGFDVLWVVGWGWVGGGWGGCESIAELGRPVLTNLK